MSRDYHSTTNQRILDKLVDREVIMCGTDIVEYSLRNCYETEDAPFTYDDIENKYRKVCRECNDELGEIEESEIIEILEYDFAIDMSEYKESK